MKQFFAKIFSRIKPIHLIILAAALLILGAVLGLRLFLKPGLTFPANTTIVPAKGAYAFKNTTNEFQTEFKSKFTDPDSIVFKNDLGKISFYTPSGQSFGDINSDNPPVADGSTLTYPAIFPQIDLRYTISNSRLLEEFIVKDAETAAQISRIEQRAQTKNTYVENDDGSITFYNKENQEAFTLPHPVMYETGNPENKSAGIIYEIKADQSELVITKVITEEGQKWLADPKRVYPIAIDLVIDNADTSSSWISSDATNTTVSLETTIKQEGTGSVKVQTTAGAPVDVDLFEFAIDNAARAPTIAPAINATGGTITYSGGYTIHTFTSSGTFTANSGSGNVEVLTVAGGGGGGGWGGGGGGGGVIYNSSYAITPGNITVTIGAGGAAGTSGYTVGGNGNNSVFGSLTAIGGGGGGAWSTQAAGNGGSGGGGSGVGSFGTGTAGQGNNGGAAPGTTQSTPYLGHGGGGGAGAAGQGPMVGVTGGAGGIGLSYSISGTTTYYGGGGGGHSPGENNAAVALGGLGGGGNGGNYYNNLPAYSGTANTGGGGGGNYGDATRPIGAGGSGIVIVRYPTGGYPNSGYVSNGTGLDATGGTITTSGDYTIHTFTSNGTFTPSESGNVEALVVAGGGGGGMDMGGGGGGGGVIYNSNFAVSASANVNTIASCKAILDAGASTGNGVYTIDPDGTGGNAPFQAYCNMTYDGGGWTMAVKSWYGSGMIGNTGAVGAVADATTRKGNAYKLSDVNIRNIIGASNNFDVMVDQNGYNSAYSTGNYEYVVLRNYTGSWTYASGGMPASISTTVFQSYRISDNALAWTGNIPCYSGTGLSGINCAGSTYQNPQGGAGCYINMGTASNAGWYHFYMNNSNDDTYLYICNGPQHSSSYDLNHRWWIRERGNVIVGIGGRGAPAASTVGQPGAHQYTIGASNGQDSKFYTLTAIGGGRGGSSYYAYTPGASGASGGSGGGSSAYSDGSTRAGGAGTAGQGYAGGQGGGQYYSGGGGGAGAVGISSPAVANGGAGIQYSSISPLYWGGGGGGSSYTLATASNGGIGGGGGGTRYAGSGGTGGAGLNNGQTGGTGFSNAPGAPGGNGGTNTGGGGGGGTHYNNNNKGGDGGSGIVIIRHITQLLQSYTEGTIKTQGTYALKGVANQTTNLNKTLTRTIASPLNLSDKSSVTFDIRASRTGSNIKVGLHDSGGTTTEVTPNITQAGTFQSATIDLSGVTNANKDAIDQIIITIVNADAANTFYLDNMVAAAPSSLNDTVTRTTAATDLSAVASITYWVRSSVAGSYATLGFGESAATEQTQSITINQANTWEQKTWNIESISSASRNAVTKFAFTFTGDTSGASFYFDDIQTNALFAPTLGVATGLTDTSIRWNFTDNSTEETGFKIYDSAGTTVLVTCASANLTYCDETGLSPNTQYTRKIGTYNASSASIASGTVSGYTLAAVPAAPVVSSRAATTVSVNPGPGANPAAILMAIYREEGSTCDGAGGVYLAANGSSNGATAIWQTDAAWATVTASGLTSEKSYVFCAKAKNNDSVETAFSSVGSHNAGFVPLSGDYVCTQDTVNSSSFTNRYIDGSNPARYVIALDKGSFLTTLDLDLMEYSSNSAAQAGYVSNAAFSATGGTITTSGGYTIHKFTSSGTFTPNGSGNVEVLVVGGGGGGGGNNNAGSGGGGGGGVLTNTLSVTQGSYSVTVGAGGSSQTSNARGNSGGNSVFSTLTAIGGGGGGTMNDNGGNGGSGGGSGWRQDFEGTGWGYGTGGNGTTGQGNNGGGVHYSYGGGGGGGAGSAGGWAPGYPCIYCYADGGVGGSGFSSSISGINTTYGAGGTGGTANVSATSGAANTGNGGTGSYSQLPSSAGGSGIVIVRYLPSTNDYLQSYSDPTNKTQGTYALRGVANQTTSLNKTLTRTLASTIDLSGRQSVTFNIAASRTGSNIKVGLRDAGGTITEVTPNITSANIFQTATIGLSDVTNANKDAINQIIITVVNADAANTFYIDNIIAIEETTATNDAVFEAKSCIMTLNSTDTLVVGSLSLTGGSIAIADGGVIKIKQPVWIIDADGDGYSADGKLYYGAQPAGGRRKNLATTLVAGSSDCNDASYNTSNVCCTIATRYRDADGDGYGNPSVTISSCPIAGYVDNASDCYDSNANVKPGSTICSTSHRGDGSYDWNCSGGGSACGTGYYSTYYAGTNWIVDENECGTNKAGEPKCCAGGSIYLISSGVGCSQGGYAAGYSSQWWTCGCGGCLVVGTTAGGYGTQACQ